MEKIRVTGKLVKRWLSKESEAIITLGNAEIELTPPTEQEIAELKEGDKVLVNVPLWINAKNEYWREIWACYVVNNIVAILPKSHPPKEELPKEKPIEESSFSLLSIRYPKKCKEMAKDLFNILAQLQDKLNEVIRRVNKKEG